MRLALLFSGQGGQRPEHFDSLRRNAAPDMAEALSQALPELWGTASPFPEQLAANRVAQPFIFGLQMTRWSQLRSQLPRPVCAAGYSLGEMAATAAAGAFSGPQGVRLCAERARLMDDAAMGENGMLAVLGLEDAAVVAIASQCGLAIAIRNGPRHQVLAGGIDGITEAETLALSRGASRAVRLAVQTPSHTPALTAATAAFAQQLTGLPGGRLDFPVLSAIDGRPSRTHSVAFNALARQISTPLDWEACLATLVEIQPDGVLEIGPCNALSRMLSDLAPNLPVRACDDFRSLEAAVAWVCSLAG